MASPQVDVLVLQPEYPTQLLDKKMYLVGGILAAFECKTTLKAEHLKKAAEAAAAVKRMLPARKGTPYKELTSPILFGLLAHSHVWKGKGSTPLENIENALWDGDS